MTAIIETRHLQPIALKKLKAMELHIESPHIESDKKSEQLIRKKFEHLAKKYDRIENCDVILRQEKSDIQNYFFIEAKMEVPKASLLSSNRSETFDIALNKVIEDLEHQLRRLKEEMEERR